MADKPAGKKLSSRGFTRAKYASKKENKLKAGHWKKAKHNSGGGGKTRSKRKSWFEVWLTPRTGLEGRPLVDKGGGPVKNRDTAKVTGRAQGKRVYEAREAWLLEQGIANASSSSTSPPAGQ